MTAAEICAHRLSIITGHYGTGKTELSVNLALSLASGEGLRLPVQKLLQIQDPGRVPDLPVDLILRRLFKL